MDKRWYIVHAYSNFEKKVQESIREQAKQRGLEELFEQILVPTEKVTEAFKIITSDPNVKGILVNIFGGIMKCDTIANGVVTACKAVNLSVPLVVRMKGTNEQLGKQILADSGLPIKIGRAHV